MKIREFSKEDCLDPKRRFVLENVNIEREDFSGRATRNFIVINSHFSHCLFENMKVESLRLGSGPKQSTYIDCSFNRSNFQSGPLGNVKFVNCSFRDIVLSDFIASQGEFINCIFSGKIRGTVFFGKPIVIDKNVFRRERNEFYGNDFREVDFRDTDFRNGIDLTKQKLPTSDKYIYLPDGKHAIEDLKKIMENTGDMELKSAINIRIKGCCRDLAEGQTQFFHRVDELMQNISNKPVIINEVARIFREIEARQEGHQKLLEFSK